MSSKDLALISEQKDLVAVDLLPMVQRIEEKMPAMMRDSDNFYKSHSQYMYALLDVTAITPIRRVKHILAEVSRTKGALEEATLKQKRNDIDIRELEAKLAAGIEDPFERERTEIDLLEKQVNVKNISNSISGAIRKLAYFTTQYEAILKSLGKDHITEEDYEKEEDRYHIMTCMKQALISARPRGGWIDEGNNIYLFDMGLPAAEAQMEVHAYLQREKDMMANGVMPTHEMTMRWLESLADKWAGVARKNAEYRGWQLYDDKSVLKRGAE